MKRYAVININLQYEFPENTTDEEIKNFIENIYPKLPKEYMEDSMSYIIEPIESAE